MTITSKSAQTIQNILSQEGLDLKVIEFSSSTRTAQEAAQAIGCEVGQIVKSLIFKTTVSNKPVLILVSGPNRVHEKVIEQEVGEKLEKADANFTREVTGFAIGGIPPIGFKQSMKTFIDVDLLQYKELWAAAGTPHTVFCLDPIILQKLTGGKIISLK